MKKPLDIFCEIVAWLLSIVLVITLLITPFTFSVLSLLSTKTITKVVSDILTADEFMEGPRLEGGIQAVSLSDVKRTNSLNTIGRDALSDMFGSRVTREQIDAVLSSKAARELIDAYTKDLTNAFADKDEKTNFNARTIKRVVDDNIDEIVDILREVAPECRDMERSELRKNIREKVNEHADEIVEMMPDPRELREDVSANAPLLDVLMRIFAMKNKIKLLLIAVIVVLSGLLFVCRLRWMSGFCWLGVDYLTAGGLGLIVALLLSFAASAIGQSAEDYGVTLVSLAGSLLGTFTGGMLTGFVVILVLGGVFLTAHFLIKLLKKKKQPQANPNGQYMEYMA